MCEFKKLMINFFLSFWIQIGVLEFQSRIKPKILQFRESWYETPHWHWKVALNIQVLWRTLHYFKGHFSCLWIYTITILPFKPKPIDSPIESIERAHSVEKNLWKGRTWALMRIPLSDDSPWKPVRVTSRETTRLSIPLRRMI